MYMYGKGVKQDYIKAAKLFTLAAEQGWVDGQLNLGYLHFSKLIIFLHFEFSFLTIYCHVSRINKIFCYSSLGADDNKV